MTSVQDNGQVEFRFFRPEATEVSIAGDFNGWDPSVDGMTPDGQGWWIASLTLPPGEYRFRYHADGQWFTDFAAQGVEMSKFGWNSLLLVPGEVEEESLVIAA
jgi:1,4-alpha-glucan branching enzyme